MSIGVGALDVTNFRTRPGRRNEPELARYRGRLIDRLVGTLDGTDEHCTLTEAMKRELDRRAGRPRMPTADDEMPWDEFLDRRSDRRNSGDDDQS